MRKIRLGLDLESERRAAFHGQNLYELKSNRQSCDY